MLKLIDISCQLKHETPKAWLLDTGDAEPVWVPKSIGELERSDDGKSYVLILPEWLAMEKGLI